MKENNIQWLPQRIVYEDTLFVTEALLRAKRISVFQECLYFRRWHSVSTMHNFDAHFGDWPTIMKMVLNFVNSVDPSLIPYYQEHYFVRTDVWFHRISFSSQCKYLNVTLDLYEYCVNMYHLALPDRIRKTLRRHYWLAPIRIGRLLLGNPVSLHLNFPLFSLNRKREQRSYKEIHELTCKILIFPLFKMQKIPFVGDDKFFVFGLPILKIKRKGGISRFYLLFCIRIWKKDLFKKISLSSNERLTLCFDNLREKDAEAIDCWTYFKWLQKQKIPSRYIVLKDNPLVSTLKQQGHSFQDIIILNDWREFLTTCHNEICRSKLILTSFGCESYNKILQKIPYLRYIFIEHGVTLLKESSLFCYDEDNYDNILVPTKPTAKLYQSQQLWRQKELTVGMPRWNRLHRVKHDSKNIFVFFTWRRKMKKNLFVLKNYQQHVFNFLTNPKLAELLKKHKINLNIALHHNLILQNVDMVIPENVQLISPTNLSQIIDQTDLMITDYSSIMFDFMFLDIPVISYRFDADYPFLTETDKMNSKSAKSHDHELYNIFYDEDAVIQKIEYYINHNFELEPEYKKINDSLFWEKENICQHLYDAIQKLPPKKK